MAAFLASLLLIIPLWKICGRAGFHPALSLLAIVPLIGFLVVAGILAFVEWPATRQRLLTQGD
ncbi:hypothetical protein [Janthinobacterium fluminis]|uniref:Uncharacterized protein n=1 Tax=Janthinobacterium fluminis TaxID=2987524 RepID=A0ABT5JVJ1_9BURK|nr:hypothetical protein [Janthinobacterium fluminis]MDC8756435.1 hypothetical protein [Janthinobacterium fluminis]